MATLNPDEIQALMSAIQTGQVAPEAAGGAGAPRGPVTPYDLTSQDRVIRGQLPTLDAINEQVASLLGNGLSGRTRLSLRVQSSPATLLKFIDFNSLLAPPSTVCVLSLGKGGGQGIVVLEPGLSDALLAAALGDRRARTDDVPTEPRRDLTSVERQVLKRLLTLLTSAMTVAWEKVLPFRPEVLRFESDPRLAVIAPPNEAAILCSFEVTGAFAGRLQLALPYSAVEPAKKLLASPPRLNMGGDARFAKLLATEIQQVDVALRVHLGTSEVTVQRLLDLEIGDVLTLNTSEGSALPVFVEGKLKILGQPRVVGGGMAVVVEQGPTDDLSLLSDRNSYNPAAQYAMAVSAREPK